MNELEKLKIELIAQIIGLNKIQIKETKLITDAIEKLATRVSLLEKTLEEHINNHTKQDNT